MCFLCRMAQDGKVLALGVLAGAAGISLAAVWYQRRNTTVEAAGTQNYHLFTSANAAQPGTSGTSPSGQAEVLDRLGALIQCVSELKQEVRALKDAIPDLSTHVRDELRGRGHRSSTLNRSTPSRRKRASGAARAEGQSSEEAESEGG